MNRELFIKAVNENFKGFDKDFFDKVEIYKSFLQQYNKNINLTRLDSEQAIYGEYFLDSILPFKTIDFSKYIDVLDIGSGSGIPGVVLKILFPQINLTIIESNGKKVTFLKLLCEKLNIEAKIFFKRAEEMRNNEREKFDLVTSRAVSELNQILEISVAYCKVNGLIIEPKGMKYQEELNHAEWIIKSTDLELLEIIKLKTTFSNNVLIFRKNSITDKSFPRE
jgi:16S rRNA (guanine527-N7)-methyltransferase